MAHEESLGRIEVIAGCMASGKSMVLIHRLDQVTYQFGAGTTMAFHHFGDSRGTIDMVASRNGVRLKAKVVRNSADILLEVRRTPGLRAIGIDEAQFYEMDLVAVAETLADDGIRVICAGIDTDLYGRPFGPMPQLYAACEKPLKRYAWCAHCPPGQRNRAYRTQWIGAGPPPLPGERRPGGGELYEPRCRACFDPPPVP